MLVSDTEENSSQRFYRSRLLPRSCEDRKKWRIRAIYLGYASEPFDRVLVAECLWRKCWRIDEVPSGYDVTLDGVLWSGWLAFCSRCSSRPAPPHGVERACSLLLTFRSPMSFAIPEPFLPGTPEGADRLPTALPEGSALQIAGIFLNAASPWLPNSPLGGE